MVGFANSRAVLIGINDYTDPDIPQLRSPLNDIEYVKSTLSKQQYQTDVRVDAEATLAGLYELLAGLSSGPDAVGPNDRLLLYFAGHGVAIPSDTGPVGYLVPRDARVVQGQLDPTSL